MEHWDAVIVGSGLAGLTVALALPSARILLVTKTADLPSGSTPWAQGGVAFPTSPQDIPDHIQDTLISGSHYNNVAAVEFLVTQAPAALAWLESQGVVFDRDEAGNYLRGREGAHSQRRILHVGADATGEGLTAALVQQLRTKPNVTVRCLTFVVGLFPGGVTLYSADRGFHHVQSSRVVLAGGGLGQLFEATTAPVEGTGDAIALGLAAGARVTDLEMVQFHPTALLVERPGPGPLPLLTEALRGEGAVIVTAENEHSDVFELDVGHPLGSLGPRDVLARAIHRRRKLGFPVWLDARGVPDSQRRFPTVHRLCASAGLNPAVDLLPIASAVHYTMGGIVTDLQGRTSLPGVWAVGECANSGVHGANRLASNSLLECVVFGLSAARSATSDVRFEPPNESLDFEKSLSLPTPEWAASLRRRLAKQMSDSAGPVRDAAGLRRGLAAVADWEREWKHAAETAPKPQHWTLDEIVAILETRNLLHLGRATLQQALDRTVSLGAHFRSDSPEETHVRTQNQT